MILASQGPAGAVAALAILFAWYKDRQYQKLQEERSKFSHELINGYRRFAQDMARAGLVDLTGEEREEDEPNDKATQLERGLQRDQHRPQLSEREAQASNGKEEHSTGTD